MTKRDPRSASDVFADTDVKNTPAPYNGAGVRLSKKWCHSETSPRQLRAKSRLRRLRYA